MATDLDAYEPAGDRSEMNLFGVHSPNEVINAASAIATPLADLIKERDLSTMIEVKVKNKETGQHEKKKKRYVHLEGWQTLGSMLGVTAIIVGEPVELFKDDGKILGYRAYAEARTLDGRVIGGAWSMCTNTESRGPWGRAAPHALLGMAQTRAMSRALKGPLGFVMKLAGYEPTPAEEMEATVVDAATEQPLDWGDDEEIAARLQAEVAIAQAADVSVWSPARITARLAGADDAARMKLLDELVEWNTTNAGGTK